MTKTSFILRIKIMAYSIFKIFPLIKPFFKEMFMGGSVPTAGKTRNRLLPVLGILLVILVVTVGSLITNWVSSYDSVQKLELRVDIIQQQLTECSRLLVLRNNEVGDLTKARNQLELEKTHLESKITSLETTGKELLVTYQETSAKLLLQEQELVKLRLEVEKHRAEPPRTAVTKPKPKKKKLSKYTELLKETES